MREKERERVDRVGLRVYAGVVVVDKARLAGQAARRRVHHHHLYKKDDVSLTYDVGPYTQGVQRGRGEFTTTTFRGTSFIKKGPTPKDNNRALCIGLL